MSLVSNNIKYLRKLNGLTQEQFARRIGIKRSLLGAYEEARANPNYNNLVSMAKAFNTTVDILLKQDLQRIRHTPELNLPLQNIGQPVTREKPISPVFSDDNDSLLADDSTTQDADFVFGNQPERTFRAPVIRDPTPPHTASEADRQEDLLTGPQPQPLASVLEKYYRDPTPPTAEHWAIPAGLSPTQSTPQRVAERSPAERSPAERAEPVRLRAAGPRP